MLSVSKYERNGFFDVPKHELAAGEICKRRAGQADYHANYTKVKAAEWLNPWFFWLTHTVDDIMSLWT
jgi:hypothetical protein